jgi:hypothetical protein
MNEREDEQPRRIHPATRRGQRGDPDYIREDFADEPADPKRDEGGRGTFGDPPMDRR